MRDLLSWNLYLGRVAGVHLRLHGFFVLLALVFLMRQSTETGADPAWFAPVTLGCLLLAVVCHELGHVAAALQVGGRVEQLVLWPLGGLQFPVVPRLPVYELRVALAGPLANLTCCLALIPALWQVGAAAGEVVHPLAPPIGDESFHWGDALKLLFWTNWVLALANLLPAFPLDGGRIYRALLWERAGMKSSMLWISKLAQATGVGLALMAWAVRHELPYATAPLVAMGCLLFFSARQEGERMQEIEPDEPTGLIDYAQGGVALKQHVKSKPRPVQSGMVAQWLHQRRVLKEKRQRELAQEEERRLDDVLVRLHEHGLERLSPEDRALLERVSSRYRDRRGR